MRVHLLMLLTTCLAFGSLASAEDVFYSVPLEKLTITDGEKPGPATQPMYGEPFIEPRAVLDGTGEAFVLSSGTEYDHWNIREQNVPLTVTARVPAAREITGSLYLSKLDKSGAVRLRFSIPAAASSAAARDDFYTAELNYVELRMQEGAPGAAWFRYREGQASLALGAGSPTTQRIQQLGWGRRNNEEDLYALFSGGRAISENLQLDRGLRSREDLVYDEQTVDVSSIKSIDTAAIDWTKTIQGMTPPLDPLAEMIPADQHAVFFPSFDAARNVAELVDHEGTPVLALSEMRTDDARSRQRYEQQLGLSLDLLSKLLGPTMVDSIALTGSDPYYRVGTDVAVILHSPNAGALEQLLLAKISFRNAGAAPARKQDEVEGLKFKSIQSDDRSVRSFVARSGDAVIVTNSPAQLARIARVIAKKEPAIASAPEYTYFRNRYLRTAPDETAFVVLTDATIRRWCGPRWRIADARRTRAAGELAQLQCEQIDHKTLSKFDDLGEVKVAGDTVVSSVYGSYQSMTPIIELNVDRCSKNEMTAYETWRNQYQSYWRWAFDPIAAKLTNTDRKLALDLSVRPLIVQTDYREFIGLCSGVSLDTNSGDPHDAMLHFVMSLNRESPAAKNYFNLGTTVLGNKVEAFSWIGKSIALYVDHDPLWQHAEPKDWRRHPPIALRVDSTDPLKLAAFLTSLHALADQSAPNLLVWSNETYKDQTYVKIASRQGGDERIPSIAYWTAPDALLISLNEDLLKRAIDRSASPATAPNAGPTTRPWLGRNVAFQCDRGVLDLIRMLEMYGADSQQRGVQTLSWSNLPILNEWKRLHPDQDPVVVHEHQFGARLIDPAGGQYVWNKDWQTMESTVVGHPGRQKPGPNPLRAFDEFDFLNTGLSFEEQGLRARVEIHRASPGAPVDAAAPSR